MKIYLKKQPRQTAAESVIANPGAAYASNADFPVIASPVSAQAADSASETFQPVKKLYLKKQPSQVKPVITNPETMGTTSTRTASPSVKLSAPAEYGGYMPSLAPRNTRGNGYMGYGMEVKTPETSESGATSGAWRGLPSYASQAMGYLQETGQRQRDVNIGIGMEAALTGHKASGGAPSAKYRTYLDLMTPEERAKAQSLSGSDYEKLGQYVNSLNLESRFQSGEADKRQRKAAEYETILKKAESGKYAQDDAVIGQYGKGNIDLYHRPQYRYDNGAIATVESMSFNENGKEILVPTIAFGNAGEAVKLTDEQAIDRYHRTGEYLGKFNTVAEADSYAEQLHRAQDYYYNGRGGAAKQSESSQGRLIASWVTGNNQYVAHDYLGTDPGPAPEKIRFLTKTQRKTIETYSKAGDFQSVADYYGAIEWDLNAQQAKRDAELEKSWVGSNGGTVAASAVTSGALNSVSGIPAYGALLWHNLKDQVTGTYTPVDYNSDAFRLAHMSSAQQEAAQEWISDEKNLLWADSGMRHFLSNIAYSGVSAAVTNLIQLYVGGAMGLSEKALGKFVTVEMGLSAAGQSALQNLQEGQGAGDALANSTVNGIVEYGTEHMFISDYIANLGDVKKAIYSGSMKDVAVKLLKTRASRAGAEALEEVVGNIADQTWDALYNGENSEWNRRTQTILEAKGNAARQSGQSWTPDEKETQSAKEQAFMDLYVQQSVDAVLSAALSTLLMDGVPAAANIAQSRANFAQAAQRIRSDGNIQNEIDKGKLWKSDSMAHRQALKVEEQLKKGTAAVKNHDLGRLAFLNGQEFVNLMGAIGESGDKAAVSEARAILFQSQNNSTDKITVGQMGVLQSLLYTAMPTEEGKRRVEKAIRDFNTRIGNIGPDGQPLASFSDFQKAYRQSVNANATQEDFVREYRRYLMSGATVSVDGERMNIDAFWERTQAENPDVTREQAATIFENLLQQQHEDGLDAGERVRQARQRGEALQRESLEHSRARLEQTLRERTSVKGLTLESDGMTDEENAYIDSQGVVHLNAKRVTTESAMQYVLGHELVHSVKAAEARARLVEDILKTAQKVNGVSAQDMETLTVEYQDRYQEHESNLAKRQNRPAETISESYAREELAADMMRGLMRGQTLEKLAGTRPGWVQRMLSTVRSLAPGLRDSQEERTLQALEDRFVKALTSENALDGAKAAEVTTKANVPAQNTEVDKNPTIREDTRRMERVREPVETAELKAAAEPAQRTQSQDAETANHDQRTANVTREDFDRAYREQNPNPDGKSLSDAWERFRKDGATVHFRGCDMTFPAFWNTLSHTDNSAATQEEAAAMFVRLMERQENSAEERFSIEDGQSPTYQELIQKKDIPVIRIDGNTEGVSFTQLQARTRQIAEREGWYNAPFRNDDTGLSIFIQKKTLTHSRSGIIKAGVSGYDTMLILEHLPKLVKYSVLTKIDPPRDVNKLETRVFTFLAAVNKGEETIPVKLTAKEYSSSHEFTIPKEVLAYHQTHQAADSYNLLYDAKALEIIDVEKMESGSSDSVAASEEAGANVLPDSKMKPGASANVAASEKAVASSTPDSTISIQELLSLVNDNFSEYVPESDESSRRYSITPEFADWFEKQTGERLNVSGKFLDAEGKPVYDASRTVDDRAGVLELARQNRELRKNLEHWKGQTRLTDSKTKVLKNVTKVSETILKSYDSILKPVDIRADMSELANLLIQGPEGEGTDRTAYLAWTAELERRSTDIASQIVKNARVLVNDGEAETYREIKKAIRAARISYEAEQGDIPDFNDYRRHNFGRMTLAKDGRSVDVYWKEWQERFGYEYFPSEVISTADMLLHISGLLDSFEPIYENPHSAYMAQAIEACSNDILDTMINSWQENFTAADRQRANEEAAAARMSDLARKAIRHERELGERRLRAFKDDQQQRLKDRRQQQAIRDERERLLRLRKRLTNMRMVRANQDYRSVLIGDLTEAALNLTGMDAHELTALLREHPEEMNPQSDKYDPEFLRKRIAEWAGSKYGERQERERMQEKTARELTSLYNTNRAEYNKRMKEWREGKAPVERKAVTDLSPEEIKDLTIVLQAFEHELRTADRLLETKDRRRIAEQEHDIIEHVLFSKSWNGGAVSALLTPERWARRVTGYAENDPLQNAMRALAQGQEREHDYLRRAYETVDAQLEKRGYDAKKRKALKESLSGKKAASEENLIAITGYDPTATRTVDVKITKGMRVSLYLAGKNLDNVRHIANGGIIIPNWNDYRKGDFKNAYTKGAVRIRLAAGDIAKIVSGMTADELAFADAVSYYFNAMSKSELADAQERLQGWSNMDTPNYFPINSSKDFTRANYEDMRRDGTLSNPGWSKSRIHGENPVYLRDANLVLEQSIRQHAKFVGLAIPVRNMNKLMNMTEFTKKGDTVSSVMEAIGNVYGNKAQDYLVKLMDDLQQGRRGEESYLSQLLAKGRSAYASSVLSLNLSVAIKQTASYPTAAAVLGAEPLMKALKDLPSTVRGKADLDLIAAYTSNLWYRSQGFSTQEMGDLTNRNQSLGDKLTSNPMLNIIQAMDVGTTTLLWKASEYYVEEHFPELKDKKGNLGERRRGESQFYQKVAEVYNQVIEETQPNYSVMQRPGILRGDSDLTQALTMFKTQPFQNFNILYDALSEHGARKRDYKANPSAENEAALKKAGRKAAAAIASQAASSFLFAFMQYGWDWFRRKDDKYKDEENEKEERTLLRWLKKLGSWSKGMGVNMAQNGFGMLPFGSELFSIIASWMDTILEEMDKDPFFETTFYGFEVGLLSALNDTVKDTGGLIRSIVKVQQAMDNDSETKPDWRDLGWNLYKAVRDYLQFAGLPIDNLRKELWAGVQQIAVRAMGESMGEYAFLEITADKETDKKAYYDLLFQSGGKQFYPNLESDGVSEDYRSLYQRMLQDGFEESDIQSEMKKRWMKTESYLKRKKQYAGLLTGTVLASPAYNRLDEPRREKLSGYIQAAAKYEMFRDYVDGYQATNSEKWIADALALNNEYKIPLPDLLILYAGKYGVTSLTETDRKGNEVAIENSEGLQIMEMAYRLFPEMEEWDAAKRRAVLEWLGVGKTLLRYNSSAVTTKLERMRRTSSPSS